MKIMGSRALGLFALLLAALLGVAVTAGWTQPGDARLLALVHHAGGDAWLAAATDLTMLGSPPVLLALLAAGAAALFVRGEPRRGAALLLVAVGGRLAIELVKDLTVRVRPPLDGLIVHGWSFPSAHAGNATITLAALALFVARGRARRPALLAAALLACAIGCTRLWLGVHWPSDVVAGWLFGVGWLALAGPIADRAMDRSGRRQRP